MKWITASDLTNWSGTQGARADLPELVGDLIRASADSVATFRFPSGDASNVRGFDGHLESSSGGFNVPEGTSYWEIKTSKDSWGEGLDDFRKRSKQIPEKERADATFVFVSSRIWDRSRSDRKIEDWVAACKKEAVWKEVDCIDAVRLESWLDECPAVAARFARVKIGLVPQRGARSTDEFWDEYRHLFRVPLVEDVLLADRQEFSRRLLEALMLRDGKTLLISDSTDEVIAFGVAAIRTAEPRIRAYLEARTIIVDEIEAGRELLVRDNLNYFLRGDAAERAGLFAEKGPTLVPLGRQQRDGQGDLLRRPTAEAMAAGLEKMGIERREAINLARGAGRSLVALRRQFSSGVVHPPIWLANATIVLPAILAGAWDQNNDLDRQILGQLAQANNYNAFEKPLRSFLNVADPLLDRVGSVWAVRAPMDAFLHAGVHIGQDILEILRRVMARVFEHAPPLPDPTAIVRINPERAEDYSHWLRDGLATMLLQIAVWDKLAEMPITGTGQAFANEVVAAIPGLGADPRVLTALRDQLPYLAEAAPDPLLSALEQTLEGDSRSLRSLFDEVEGVIFPVSYHTGLLWALETIAWDPAYFDRAVMVVARLASLDPGGSLANRPLNSLAEIFLPWHPSTKAPVAQRIASVESICDQVPEIGWQLLTRMLPDNHGISVGTRRPSLREAGSGEIGVSYSEYWQVQSAVVQLAISMADLDGTRWGALVTSASELRPADRLSLLDALDGALDKLQGEGKTLLLESLRAQVEKHEQFPNAKWVLPPDQLGPMRRLVDKYTPNDPLEKARIVFDGFLSHRRDEAVQETLQATAGSILERYGPSGLVTLGRSIKTPYRLVEAIRSLDLTQSDLEAIATKSLSENPDGLTLGYITILANKFGVDAAENWIVGNRATYGLSDQAVAKLLCALPDDRRTWTFSNRLGAQVESEYWRTKGPYWLKGDKEDLLTAIDTYIRFGRGVAALEASSQRFADLPSTKILEILEAVVRDVNANAGQKTDGTMLSYEVEQALTALNGRTDVSDEDVARREISVFPLLEHTAYKPRIFRVMSENAEVYYEILSTVFRGEDEEEKTGEATEKERSLWRLNYSLLSNFDVVPGSQGDAVDSRALSAWIKRLREIAASGHRSAITDQYIGHILAHSKPDDRGIWPSLPVREQIEVLRSDDVELGVRTERFNMRGVHSRAIYAGGEDERALAKQYDDYAATMSEWPRTQALLRSIARDWEADAAREDEWAEQRKMRG